VDAESAVRRWREAWLRGWPVKDAASIAAVYAEDATFRSQPFRDEHVGAAGALEYVEWTFSEQDAADVWCGQPVVEGGRASCEYWAVITFEGEAETLAGMAALRFDDDGLVSEQRDYWNLVEGRHEPPDGWGG